MLQQIAKQPMQVYPLHNLGKASGFSFSLSVGVSGLHF